MNQPKITHIIPDFNPLRIYNAIDILGAAIREGHHNSFINSHENQSQEKENVFHFNITTKIIVKNLEIGNSSRLKSKFGQSSGVGLDQVEQIHTNEVEKDLTFKTKPYDVSLIGSY